MGILQVDYRTAPKIGNEEFLALYTNMVKQGKTAEQIARKLGDGWTGRRVFNRANIIRVQYSQEAGVIVGRKIAGNPNFPESEQAEIFSRVLSCVPHCVCGEIEEEKRIDAITSGIVSDVLKSLIEE